MNKKLKLQNYIAKMILEIKEKMAKDEEKRLIEMYEREAALELKNQYENMRE